MFTAETGVSLSHTAAQCNNEAVLEALSRFRHQRRYFTEIQDPH